MSENHTNRRCGSQRKRSGEREGGKMWKASRLEKDNGRAAARKISLRVAAGMVQIVLGSGGAGAYRLRRRGHNKVIKPGFAKNRARQHRAILPPNDQTNGLGGVSCNK